MERRQFLRGAATGAAAVGLVACTGSAVTGDEAGAESAPADAPRRRGDHVALDSSLPEIHVEMATSWPLGLDTIYGGAEVFAQGVSAMSGGRFRITPRAAGELVPALEVLDGVQSGGVAMGHTASYYYVGKTPVMAFGTALPFRLNDRQQNAWLFEGDGLEMLPEIYANRFNVIQFLPATPACRWADPQQGDQRRR